MAVPEWGIFILVFMIKKRVEVNSSMSNGIDGHDHNYKLRLARLSLSTDIWEAIRLSFW